MSELVRVEGEDRASGRAWRGWALRGERHGLWVEHGPDGWQVSVWREGELVRAAPHPAELWATPPTPEG